MYNPKGLRSRQIWNTVPLSTWSLKWTSDCDCSISESLCLALVRESPYPTENLLSLQFVWSWASCDLRWPESTSLLSIVCGWREGTLHKSANKSSLWGFIAYQGRYSEGDLVILFESLDLAVPQSIEHCISQFCKPINSSQNFSIW